MRLNIKSFKYKQNHAQDNFTNLGYDYDKFGIFNRVLSYELFSNPNQDKPMRQLERLIQYLVDTTKQIRTQFSIAHDKNTLLIN